MSTEYYLLLAVCSATLLIQMSMVMRWISFTKQPYLVMNLIQPPSHRNNHTNYVFPGPSRQLNLEQQLLDTVTVHS